LHNNRALVGHPERLRVTNPPTPGQSTLPDRSRGGEDTPSVMRMLRSRTPESAPEAAQASSSIERPNREALPSSHRDESLGWRRQRAPSQGILHNNRALIRHPEAAGAGLGPTERTASPFASRSRPPLGATRSGRPSFAGRGVQAGSAIRSPGTLPHQGFRRAR